MSLFKTNNSPEKNRALALTELINQSSPRKSFFVMISLSIIMSTFGLLLNSTTIVIGSMLIAPLLYPILSFSLGIVILDFKLTLRSVYTLIQSFIVGILLSVITTLFFLWRNIDLPEQILVQNFSHLDFFLVAFVAGLAATFALVKPGLNERLPGVAIAVALIPPLATIGIGLVTNPLLAENSITIFFLNVLGIVISSALVFLISNIIEHKKTVQKAVKKEEKELKLEEKNIH